MFGWQRPSLLTLALAIDRLAYVTSESGVGLQNRDADTSITNKKINYTQIVTRNGRNIVHRRTHIDHISTPLA